MDKSSLCFADRTVGAYQSPEYYTTHGATFTQFEVSSPGDFGRVGVLEIINYADY
jgi:hypothetical protein